MSLLDFLTGGKNQDANAALNQAYDAFARVGVPSVDQLTLPELQKYVQAGILTPEQAQAVLQQSNAYDNINTPAAPKEAEMDALAKLQEIADAGGMDAEAQQKVGEAQSQMNQALQGQRLSVLDQMAQRGIPMSLMGPAAELAFAGQDAEQAHKDSLQAAADAEQRALAALSASGSLGGQIENQNYSEAAQKAAAQNAIDQWNAANQTTVNLANANARQAANSYNAQTRQNASNANVQNENSRTMYNANLPQQVYEDKLQKASGEAGVNEKQAANATAQGQQNAGLISSLIGAGATVAGGMMGGPAGAAAGSAAGQVAGGAMGTHESNQSDTMMAHGGVVEMKSGGHVPGVAKVPGDSPKNDTVPALLSPGEVVIPRSAAGSPNMAAQFVRHLQRSTSPFRVHPEDVKNVLHALTSMRHGG